MATARETIKKALRKLRVIEAGSNPTSAELTDCLDYLNKLLAEIVGFGGSHQLRTKTIDSSYEASPRDPAIRLLCRHSGAITITLPSVGQMEIYDGMRIGIVDVSNNAATHNITVARNNWLLEGATSDLTLSTNNINRVWMFRGDLGDWKRAVDLGADDTLPFPTDLDNSMALILAQELGGEFGQSLRRSDEALAKTARIKLSSKYVPAVRMAPEPSVRWMGGATRQGLTETEWENLS
jgi:hypothetical protein